MILEAILLSTAILEPLTDKILFPLTSETVWTWTPTVKPRSLRYFLVPGSPEILTIVPLSPTFAREMGIPFHKGGRYVCIEGPRFSTRAESRMFQGFADIIGMTVVPECQLAREMGMCYCSLATITDYDAWKEEVVDIQMVLDTMAACLAKICEILERGLPELAKLPDYCECIEAAIGAGAIEKK